MIQRYREHVPRADPTAWVHPSAVLIGDVDLGPRVSVWPGVVLRGDQGAIRVGAESNLQDGTIAHATGGRSVTTIGPRVTVGHRVLLHGCHVEGDVLVGMGAILLDNCEIGPWTIIGAGALVPPGRRVPGGVLYVGVPGRVVRELTEADLESIRRGHQEYLRLAADYAEEDAR